jgi:hypothetical protein
VADEHDIAQIQRIEQCDEVRDVVVEGVHAVRVRLLRQTEADLVRHDHTVARGQQWTDHVPPQEPPRGVAVQQQDRRRIAGAFVDVGHPPAVHGQEPRAVGVARPRRGRQLVDRAHHGDQIFWITHSIMSQFSGLSTPEVSTLEPCRRAQGND